MRIRINFASREYLLVRKVYLALCLALAAAVAVFAVNYGRYSGALRREGALAAQVRAQEQRASELRGRLAAIKKKVNEEDVMATAKQAQFANAAIAKRAFSWTVFLNRLEEVVPPGVGVQRINPNFGTLDVDLTGTATDVAQVTKLLEGLTGSPYFEDIPPVFNTAEILVDKDTGKTLQQFSIRIRYNPAGRAAGGTRK